MTLDAVFAVWLGMMAGLVIGLCLTADVLVRWWCRGKVLDPQAAEQIAKALDLG
ncbi:hypothetical protein [Longimicrobium sp.]|jgi:hypothetical protein|uniref:hypothetical protein n=1 Tax=Longimicrobium sp. TaxID=2029185 RepID=UPI002F942799